MKQKSIETTKMPFGDKSGIFSFLSACEFMTHPEASQITHEECLKKTMTLPMTSAESIEELASKCVKTEAT